MKKTMKIVCASVWALVLLLAVICQAETKYGAGVTAAGVGINFAASQGERDLTAISAIAGANNETVDVYLRNGNACTPTESGTTNMQVVNVGAAITNGDTVILQHTDGTAQYATVAVGSTTNIALTSALSPAWTNGLRVYEVAVAGKIPMGQTNTDGIASLNVNGNPLIRIPGDSPCRLFMDSATNNYLTATVK